MLKKSITALFAFLLLACAKPKDIEYLGFGNLKILKLGAKESLVGVDAFFYNPNNNRFQFRRASVDIFINDKYLGHSELDSLIPVPKLDTFAIPVTLNVQMKNFLPNFLNTIADTAVKVRMDGAVWVKKAGFSRQVPIHYEGMKNIKF